MKVCIPILFIFLSIGFSVTAQSFTPVKDESVIRASIDKATRNVNSIKCDFTQEKNLKILSEKAVSKGKFYFKKENKVRLEYLEPNKNLIVMNQDKMLTKNEKKMSETDVHKNRLFRQLNSIILGSINGTLFMNRDFAVRFMENTNQLKVELTTVSKSLKNFMSGIVLILEKKDFTATRIEMNEPSGDNTILSFSAKQINTTMSDTLFAVR